MRGLKGIMLQCFADVCTIIGGEDYAVQFTDQDFAAHLKIKNFLMITLAIKSTVRKK